MSAAASASVFNGCRRSARTHMPTTDTHLESTCRRVTQQGMQQSGIKHVYVNVQQSGVERMHINARCAICTALYSVSRAEKASSFMAHIRMHRVQRVLSEWFTSPCPCGTCAGEQLPARGHQHELPHAALCGDIWEGHAARCAQDQRGTRWEGR
jgi:hypothetical protein